MMGILPVVVLDILLQAVCTFVKTRRVIALPSLETTKRSVPPELTVPA
ncbi:MAG: hypothetical protein ACXVZ1_11030 [Gaiellaceae bacterium]